MSELKTCPVCGGKADMWNAREWNARAIIDKEPT